MKKTIFHMVRSDVYGGLENVYLNYCKILHEEFNLVCITSKKFVHLDEIRKLGIKTTSLRYRGHYGILSTIKLFFLMKKYSPDIVIAHNGRAFSVINFYNVLFRKNFKSIAVCHGENPKRLFNFDYKITVANHVAENIKSNPKNINNDNVLTVHNGINVNHDYKPENKVKNENFTFGTLSRISHEKNIITILKAFKLFLKDVPNAQLKIAGDGRQLDNLKQYVEQENIQENVIFLGRITDIENFFSNIDVLLHAATEESFGLVIVEAFNYYTPVIGSSIGGLKEIINDGVNGYLYGDPMNEQNLYKKMHQYYFDEIKNKDKITIQARKDLEEKFSIDVTKRKLIDILKKI